MLAMEDRFALLCVETRAPYRELTRWGGHPGPTSLWCSSLAIHVKTASVPLHRNTNCMNSPKTIQSGYT